ncbi:fimbrial biogenesis usher protein [Enterobacter chengduensis]|uniref:fimbrial biogenesis usher protein n=1 Tax=Enterobacter chengduensis TaxID=2494701 RepID=UPI003D979651
MIELSLRNWIRRTAVMVACLPSSALHASDLDFDTDILASRGISTNLAHYFSDAQRYLPGQHAVQVKINGVEKGSLAIRVGEEGQLCIDDDFIRAAGLLPLNISEKEQCHNLLKDYPSATVTLLPNTESLEIFVPAEAMDNGFYAAKYYAHGGAAGLINYSAFSNYNEYGAGGSSRYTQGNLGAGINLANWTLRSNYILTDDNGTRSTENLYTYAEHVFEEQKMRAQVGQINVNSALFSGAQITGLQLMPEIGLQPNIKATEVSGIARTNQARVEVRQSGQMIYSSLVNAGPFTLTDVPVVRGNVDLDISVVETDGSTTRFTVPSSALIVQGSNRAEGLNLALGQVRDSGDVSSSPWVFTLSDGTLLNTHTSAVAAGVLAEKYQATGAKLDVSINENWTISPSFLLSQSRFYDPLKGSKAELSSNILLPAQLTLGASASQFSGGFRELTEAMDKEAQTYENNWNASLTWNNEYIGAISMQYSVNSGDESSGDSRYLMASWSKSLGRTSLSANWQHAMSNSDTQNQSSTSRNDDLFYVSLIVPFGEDRVSTYMRAQGQKQNYGIQDSGSVGQNLSYNVSADRDNQDKSNAFNGNITTNLHYTQLGLSAGLNDGNQHNYSASLNGGVALHRHGITFSPYPVKETFGIARLSEPESGIEITTPDGTVWTDRWGQAVVSGLREWQKSQIVINASSLPQGMDLSNGIQTVSAAYGSFALIDFNVLNTRRVMLDVKRANGSWLEKGLSVVDRDGNYIVSVMDNGSVFIPDASNSPALYVVDDNLTRLCQIAYTLKEEKDKDAYYEKAEGVCQ